MGAKKDIVIRKMQLVYKNKWECHEPKAVLAMTEGRNTLINNFEHKKKNNKR